MDTQASSYIHNETVQEYIKNQRAAQLENLSKAQRMPVSGPVPVHQQRALSHTMESDVTMGDSSTQHRLSNEATVHSESKSQSTSRLAAPSMSTRNMHSLLQLGPFRRSIAQRARRQWEEALRVSATQRDRIYPPSLTHGLTVETSVHSIDATNFTTTTERADKGKHIVIAETLSPQPYINSDPAGPSYGGCSSGATRHEHFPLSTRNFTPGFHLGSFSLTSNISTNNLPPNSSEPVVPAQGAIRPEENSEEASEYSDEEYYDIDELEKPTETLPSIPVERHYLGEPDVQCQSCFALHWSAEQLSSSTKKKPLFGSCCLQGKIKLPSLDPLPPPLESLFEGNDWLARDFRKNIRGYNACNAFTSLGVKANDRILKGRGPKSFTIHGELCHKIGSLLPDEHVDPKYTQLYIYDAGAALDYRQQRNKHLLKEVLSIVQGVLVQANAWSKFFKNAHEVLSSSASADNNIPAFIQYTPGTDRRRYNLPATSEIAVVLPGDETKYDMLRDIVIHYKEGGLERISECHPAYTPLHYVLLFPRGDLGWAPDLRQWDVKNNCPSDARLTQVQYYSYRLFDRPTEYSSILRGGSLYQQWIVDAWAATEQNRLRYIRMNQDNLRAEVYNGLTDIAADGLPLDQVGQRFILPSSHTGSPRHMYEIYQDSMAITRYNKHPDVFLTATANPNWPEIIRALKPHQTASDRPEVVARVFEMKRKAIMEEIKNNGVFGEQAASVYTIEFQKRGLPHMHALIFLKQPDKIRNANQVNKIVSAEFPNPISEPNLFETVKRCMVHGPCGPKNPKAPCMENGRCTKHYPRAFTDETTMDQVGYPVYRRRNTGNEYEVRDCKVDNRDVVPYNPHLSELFNCHINVEVCASVRAVKYIHKYIYKGHDRATMVIVGTDDEIKQYIDARYVGPPEAAWRLLEFSLHKELPHVERLAVHLEGMHRVVYNAKESRATVLARALNQRSTLTAFFKCCAEDSGARRYTYQEFPQYYVWKRDKKIWKLRDHGYAIGRMYFANPNAGERFYLRLLLTTVRGPTSFEDLRTVDGFEHDTFKAACVARGLLESDDEWRECLQEASVMKTGYQLRRLFSVILLECSPTSPATLWSEFSTHICDDLAHMIRSKFNNHSPTTEEIADYGLFLINKLLFEAGKTLSNFPDMPQPKKDWDQLGGNRLIWEQRELQYEGLEQEANANLERLNAEQLHAHTEITDSVQNNMGKTFFLNGAAGTGKTFVYNTIAATCRSQGHIVINVASSGIASLLLSGGRTAHSTFCLPLDIMDNTFCGFSKNSIHAELFKEVSLIIWDEVPMQHRHCVEAVERTLRDIRENSKPFGGITMVLGGDFRQTLPIVPKGSREQFVGASVRRSQLWTHVQVLHLVHNMRLEMSEPNNASFADYLIKIGTNPLDIVELPIGIRNCADIGDLISSVYPDLNVIGTATPVYLTERTILAARNDDVSVVNQAAMNLFPGHEIAYLAADKVVDDITSPQNNGSTYPSEFLNSLDPSSLPPFNLQLKIGCPIMLLRNIAPRDGLCNGTRLIVLRCESRVLEAMIITGAKAGNTVFIPRISLTPSTTEMPFQMSRRQFPVRLAFAMTINKSQGQSVKYVGINLETPAFSHGQLYVALSRCTSSKRITVLLPHDSSNYTTNIVYPEVLL